MLGLARLVIAVCAVAFAPSLAAAEKRAALVIGNAAYANAPPLANPRNDATDLAKTLETLGFKVLLGLDLGKRSFDQKVRAFADLLEEADTGLLFYAGHGLQVAGQNYLVPVDAKLAKERDLDFDTVRLNFLLRQMELGREDKTNIVILDACRDNPLTRNLARSMGTRSARLGKGLAEVKTGVGTFIAYSTQPGNVALDGTGRNSPFASALVKHMKRPGQPLTSVMVGVRKDVLAATSGRQVPWDHSALIGNFFFVPPRNTTKKPAPPNILPDVSAIEERIRKIEENIARTTAAAEDPTRKLRIMQLEERVRQIDEANKEDQRLIFDVQRERAQDPDQSKRAKYTRRIGEIMLKMTRRSQQKSALKSELSKLRADKPGKDETKSSQNPEPGTP